jgi:hypothetical protein
MIDGAGHGIAGKFDLSGLATNQIPRAASQGGPLTVEMSLNWNDSPLVISGSVSGTNASGAWTAPLLAARATNILPGAAYTAVLSPAPDTVAGYGYLLITNHAGNLLVSGALPDGAPLNQAARVSDTGALPVYANLYGGTGLLLGWIDLSEGAPSGELTWLRTASRSSGGFTNLLTVQGALWTAPPPHTAAVDLASGQLNIVGGNLAESLTYNVTVNSNNALVKLAGAATNSLTGSINPKTGLLTITFGNGAGRAVTVGRAVFLQNTSNAAGFFLSKTNPGAILLQP